MFIPYNFSFSRQSKRPATGPETAERERLRAEAKASLPGRTAYFAALMGVSPAYVKITSAKSRFGSCNSKNGICYSLYLMLYPPEAIDYVVVHELAHIRHKNHGSAFYAEIAAILPDHKARRELLRQPVHLHTA